MPLSLDIDSSDNLSRLVDDASDATQVARVMEGDAAAVLLGLWQFTLVL